VRRQIPHQVRRPEIRTPAVLLESERRLVDAHAVTARAPNKVAEQRLTIVGASRPGVGGEDGEADALRLQVRNVNIRIASSYFFLSRAMKETSTFSFTGLRAVKSTATRSSW
jgi:hypothetical protein